MPASAAFQQTAGENGGLQKLRNEELMGRIIAVANQKGGVGKTTTVVSLSAALALAEKRVLIVDFDPQANATSGFGFKDDSERGTIYDVLADRKTLGDIIISTEVTFCYLAPSEKNLSGAEVELAGMAEREFQLKAAIRPLIDEYDYIFIDCPPSLGLLTVNALAAANALLIPLQCEYYALESVTELMETLGQIRENLNPSLAVEGILLTMYDERTNLSRQVAEEVRGYFGDQVFQTIIPRNVRLGEAPSFGQPILLYDISSKGAAAYLQLSKEVMKNEKKSAWQGTSGSDS